MAPTMRLVAGLATLLWIACFATDAAAHASLVSTDPVDGSMMSQAPKSVRLRFNEPVTPASIKLIDAEGRTREDVTVNAHDDTIEVTLPDGLPRGMQLVSYRIFSADGHPVGGSLVFSLGMSEGKSQGKSQGKTATRAVDDSGLAPLIWLMRIGTYLGLFVGVGGVFFGSWIGHKGSGSRVIATALMVGLFSAVASLGLQGLDLLDLPPAYILTSEPWKAAAGTSLFSSLLIAIVAMVISGVARLTASVSAGRVISAVAIVGVGLSLAASGHASTAPPQWLSRPMMFLHGIGVAFWVGALTPLLATARSPGGSLLTVLNRFSRAAVPVVGVLVATGLVLAIVQLESFHALIATKYGLILSVKLTLVAGLLGLAALNRQRLTPALAVDPLNTRALVRSILAECLIGGAILAVVAGWRFTPPPRSLVTAAATPLAIHIHSEEAMFQVLVSPGRVGTDNFVLQLMNGDASPLTAKEAKLVLSLPERGIEALERNATLGPDDYWHVEGVPIPFAGHWHIRVEAVVTDFKEIALEAEINVPAR